MRRLLLILAVLLCSAVAAWGEPPEIILESAKYTETSQDVDLNAITPYKEMLFTFLFNTPGNTVYLDVNIATGARNEAQTHTLTATGQLRHSARFSLISLEDGHITLTARNTAGESSTFTQAMRAIEGTPPEGINHIRVNLIPSEIRLGVGEQLEVTASGDPEITIFNDGFWEIVDTTIAEVNSDFPFFAYVRGLQDGETTLKYTVHDRIQDIYGTATAKVIVGDAPAITHSAPVISLSSAKYQDTGGDADLDAIIPGRQVALVFNIEDEGDSVAVNYSIETPSRRNIGGHTLSEKPFKLEDWILLYSFETGSIRIAVSNGIGQEATFERVIKAVKGVPAPTPQNQPDNKIETDGGGGGCNNGFFGLAILAAIILKKRAGKNQ